MSTQSNALATALATLTAQVTATATVEQSAITLIQGLATEIAQVATDPAAVTALANQLQASSAALAAAITSNTPTGSTTTTTP